MDDVVIIGAGIGGLTLALDAAPRRHPLPRLRGGAGDQAARRRHQPPAARDRASSRELGLEPALARVAVTTQRGGVLQPLRPAHLPRAARPPRRLRRTRSSRSTAATCRRCCSTPCASALGADRIRHRLDAASRVEQDDERRHGAFPRRRRRGPAAAARRASSIACDGIHSAMRKQLYPGRGPAALFGRQHVARRHALAADPVRREHGARRLARDRQDGDLPDPRRRRRRGPPARQLGRRDRDAAPPRSATGTAPGRLEDFIRAFADWHFDWLDVPALIRARRRGARIPDGRPGPAAALELRPRHAARRRGAPDGAARLERRRPGDPRRARARRVPRRGPRRRPRR